jgi:hypothetical protein
VILALAAAIRLGAWRLAPNIHWPDETFQVLEPAHRLAFGDGILAWEWIVGIRSYLFPGVLAGLMRLGALIGPDPDTVMLPVVLFLIALSLIPVACGYLWASRFQGPRGGVFVGLLVAVWNDLVYLAPHPLNEAVAGNLLVLGIFLGSPGLSPSSLRRIAAAGVVFALTFLLRMDLGPTLAVVVIMICWRERGRWIALMGAAIPIVLLAGGLLDWVTLGSPFQSIWLNLWLNLVAGVSEDFGTSPWWALYTVPMIIWGGLAPVILGSSIAGGRRLPVAAAALLAIFATHMLIAHKELRFAFPAIPLVIILAGLGLVDGIRLVEASTRDLVSSPKTITLAALVLMLLSSIGVAGTAEWRELWAGRRGFVLGFRALADKPDLCGVALVDLPWGHTPGSAGLPLGATLYEVPVGEVARYGDGFNGVLADGDIDLATDDSRFVRMACFPSGLRPGMSPESVCVWERAGQCRPGVAPRPRTLWPFYFEGPGGEPRADRVEHPGR